jgi:hypothetical protein
MQQKHSSGAALMPVNFSRAALIPIGTAAHGISAAYGHFLQHIWYEEENAHLTKEFLDEPSGNNEKKSKYIETKWKISRRI